jgi:Gtp-binding protein of the ras superfamily involved in termination of M-phase
VRQLNKTALPFLVGTKFDVFYGLDHADQAEIIAQARKFAKAMKAPLVFCSAAMSVNVPKLFRLVFEKAFSLDTEIEMKHGVGEPIFEY